MLRIKKSLNWMKIRWSELKTLSNTKRRNVGNEWHWEFAMQTSFRKKGYWSIFLIKFLIQVLFRCVFLRLNWVFFTDCKNLHILKKYLLTSPTLLTYYFLSTLGRSIYKQNSKTILMSYYDFQSLTPALNQERNFKIDFQTLC